MLKQEIFPGLKLKFLDPDLDLAHPSGSRISELYHYESCKYVFLILHPEDMRQARSFLTTGKNGSYFYPGNDESGQRRKSWVEKEVESGFTNAGFGYVTLMEDRFFNDGIFSFVLIDTFSYPFLQTGS